MKKECIVYLIDTSAILSGKPLNFTEEKCVTTPKIAEELSPGGKDYFHFQMLCEKGLMIMKPSMKSTSYINNIIEKYGEGKRLSTADKELLALAYELKQNNKQIPVIISDDYSIQNIANDLQIKVNPINQKEITKSFKWGFRCSGCRKIINEDVDVCPICGSSVKPIVINKKPLKKMKRDY